MLLEEDVDVDSSSIGNQQPKESRDDGDSIHDMLDSEDDDLTDEDESGLDEDALRGMRKLNSVATILSLRKKPTSSSRYFILLCRMVAMPMVRPTLQSNLLKLEKEFVHGYREGAAVFYVSLTNESGQTQEVTDADKEAWGPH